MKPGDKVQFEGRPGTVVGRMPAGMVDIRMADTGSIERRHESRLSTAARPNGRRRARRNGEEEEAEERPSRQESPKLTWEQKEAQERRDQAEQLTAYKRTAGRKVALNAERSIDQELRRNDGVFFAQEDPPRFASDGSNYCGNPIDGVAYFIAVSQQSISMPRWLTWDDLREHARRRKLEGAFEDPTFRNTILRSYEAYLGRVKKGSSIRGVVLRKGVGPHVRPGMGLREELAIREKKVEAPSLKTADPERDFYTEETLPSGGKQRTFYEIYTKAKPAEDKLRRFQPFRRRFFRAPEKDDPELVQKYGRLAAAVVKGSKRLPGLEGAGIHPTLAVDFIRAGGVFVDGQIRFDPTFADFEPGARLSLGFYAKGGSPLFSWVPSFLPIAERKLAQEGMRSVRGGVALAPCLTADDKKYLAELRQLKGILSELNSSLGSVRRIFGTMVLEPERLTKNYVVRAAASIARAYAKLLTWDRELLVRLNSGSVEPYVQRVAWLFSNSVLSPFSPTSPYAKMLYNLQTSTTFSAMLEGGEWREVEVKGPVSLRRANVANKVRSLTKRGYETVVQDRDLGIVAYRTKKGQTKSILSGEADFDILMEDIKKIVLDSAPMEDIDPEMGVSQVQAAVRRPGIAALRFFEGTKPVPHPLDDLYAFVKPSLGKEVSDFLVQKRNQAGDKGVAALRSTAPRRAGAHTSEASIAKTDEVVKAAFDLRRILGSYAVGGEVRGGERFEPLPPHNPFELRLPSASWPVSLEQQLDMNWVIVQLADRVFPALVWEKGMTPDAAGVLCRDLLLLAMLYELLGGHDLAGPLNPTASAGGETRLQMEMDLNRLGAMDERLASEEMSDVERQSLMRQRDDLERVILQRGGRSGPRSSIQLEPDIGGLLSIARKQVSEEETKVQGGRSLAGVDRKFRTYVTYNPILFELTRLFWPESRSKVSGLGNLLSHPNLVLDIDAVGRFGHVVQLAQEAMARNDDPASVTNDLTNRLTRGATTSSQLTMKGEMLEGDEDEDEDQPRRTVKVEGGVYDPFLLLWAVGSSEREAVAEANALRGAPLVYVDSLKKYVEGVVSRARHTRRVGYRAPHSGQRFAPSKDVPMLHGSMFTGRPDSPAIPRQSYVTAERSVQESDMLAMLGVIDRSINDLEEQIRRSGGKS